jgi:single-stranded DNA-binding protein
VIWTRSRVRSFVSYVLESFCGTGPEMLNHVTLIGKVTDAGPKLTYSDNGQPECRWTLAIEDAGAQGKVFTTYIPCSARGKPAETLAEQLEPGQLVCIRDGRLTFRRTLVQGEQVSQLEGSTWSVSVLTPAVAEA